jgi:hypothetical protein
MLGHIGNTDRGRLVMRQISGYAYQWRFRDPTMSHADQSTAADAAPTMRLERLSRIVANGHICAADIRSANVKKYFVTLAILI